MHPDDSHAAGPDCALRVDHLQRAIHRKRQIELANLIALRKIRIEVILAIPFGEACNVAVERERGFECQPKGPLIHHRQRPRQSEADRTDLRVWRCTECCGATAEKLGKRLQLHVDFQSDNRRKGHLSFGRGCIHRGLRLGLRVEICSALGCAERGEVWWPPQMPVGETLKAVAGPQ